MSKKTMTLTLQRSVIMDAVKTDTHIKGVVDKSADGNASQLAYNESAGDDEYHERKLERTMISSTERLVSEISDMFSGSSEVSSDFSDNTTIVIKVDVDSRFNSSFSNSLSRLCSEFITNSMLELWWGVINQNQAQFYTNLCATNLLSIRKCFNKVAPNAPGETILDTKGTIA